MLNTTKLYETIADAMPMEGRDFTLDQVQQDGQPPKLVVRALTAVGLGFVPVLMERLAKPMAEDGVTLAGDGVPEREMETIAAIQSRAEQEGSAKVAAKLAELDKAYQYKQNVATNMRHARMSEKGADAPMSDEERAAHREASEARKAKLRLQRIADRIPEMRKELDAAAKAKAATDDTLAPVDRNAPLLTLFDRQTVAETMKYREETLHRLAAMYSDADALKEEAASRIMKYAKEK